MPGNYTAQSADARGLGDGSISGCPALTNDPPGTGASAGVALIDSATDVGVGDALLSVNSANVSNAMDILAGIPRSCPVFTGTVTVQGTTFDVQYHTAPSSFPALGDRTVAFQITADIGGVGLTVVQNVVIVQRHDVIMFVSNEGIGAVDSGLTSTAVHAAYAKVAARW